MAEKGLTGTEVARHLDLSEAEVSRLKNEAEQAGSLRLTCQVSKAVRDRVEDMFFPHRAALDQALAELAGGRRRPAAWVVNSGSTARDRAGYDRRLRRFALEAAPVLAPLVGRGRTIGLTWGKTLDCLIGALRGVVKPPRPGRPGTVVPLAGVLVNDPKVHYSATSLAAQLAEVLAGDAADAPSLGAVPARIPAYFAGGTHAVSPDEAAVLRRFVEGIPGYRQVFLGSDDDPPLVDRMTVVLSSVGCDYEKSGDPWLMEMLTWERLSKDDLGRLTVGDIGGVFLPHPQATRKDRDDLDRLNRRSTGVTFAQLLSVADRARKDRTAPGVVVAAVGSWKAGVVRECVRLGLANGLIVDHSLGAALAGKSAGAG
jgi:DNA-binding transcriptional regulator LsrR (DeoR family)